VSGGTGSSAQARSRSHRAQRQARTACSWCRSRPRRRCCTGTWRVITCSVSMPILRPKKNTVVLAASLRSALRIRSWFFTTALCLATPHSHALSGQQHKVAPSWSLASDFPGLDARFSLIAWTSDTSLILHFQGNLCMVVAVDSLRNLESAELYVFITQRLP